MSVIRMISLLFTVGSSSEKCRVSGFPSGVWDVGASTVSSCEAAMGAGGHMQPLAQSCISAAGEGSGSRVWSWGRLGSVWSAALACGRGATVYAWRRNGASGCHSLPGHSITCLEFLKIVLGYVQPKNSYTGLQRQLTLLLLLGVRNQDCLCWTSWRQILLREPDQLMVLEGMILSQGRLDSVPFGSLFHGCSPNSMNPDRSLWHSLNPVPR